MEISFQAFDRICRVCLIECSDMKSLFMKMDGENRNLLEILAFAADINVKIEDSLPKQVCGECQTIMCKADAFKRRCLNSETILNNIYQNSLSRAETSNIDKKCSIKDENGDITANLSNYILFEPSNITNYCSQDGFDKKNLLIGQTSIYPIADTSFCKLTDTKVPENPDQSVKEEINLNFDDEISFSDHYDDETQCERIPVELKDEKPLKSEGKKHTCCCGLEFTAKDKYKSHLKQQNCNKYKKLLEKVAKNKLVTVKNDIECVECNQKFKTPNDWRIHQQVHRNEHLSENKSLSHICKFCLTQFKTQAALKTHILKHEKTVNSKPESYQCSFCLRNFKNKTSLSAHIQRHELTDSIKHVCKVCKREFKYKAYLENHVLTMHLRKNGISCEVCGQSFPNKESMEIHKESHKNEKKHRCNICNKAFLMLCTLKEHMRTHTGEKPFLCSQCGRGFSQKTNLAQHMRRHQGLKPFKCENCEKR